MPSLLVSLHALGLTAHSRADWAPIKKVSSAHCVPWCLVVLRDQLPQVLLAWSGSQPRQSASMAAQ